MEEETQKMGIERDAKGRFLKGKAPRGGRPKGVRDWKTDFNEAIKLVAKQTGRTESEIRMEFLARGIAEGRKGNFNFWKEIVERNKNRDSWFTYYTKSCPYYICGKGKMNGCLYLKEYYTNCFMFDDRIKACGENYPDFED